MKTAQVKVWHVVVLSTIIGILVTIGVIMHFKEVRRLKSQLTENREIMDMYKITVNGLKEEVKEARLWVFSTEKALSLSEAQVERLKQQNLNHVIAIGQLRTQVKAFQDSLPIYKYDTVYRDRPIELIATDKGPMIGLPASFGWSDDWAESWAVITEDGNGESGFTVKQLPIELTLGYRGLFNREYVSAVSSANPYLSVQSNQFSVVKRKSHVPVWMGVGSLLGGTAVYFLMR